MLLIDLMIIDSASVKDALKQLDNSAGKVLLVVNHDNRLLGTITDGDIRRYILRGGELENSIEEIYNRKPKVFYKEQYSIEAARKMFIDDKLELVPVLDREDKVIDFITWTSVFSDTKSAPASMGVLDIPVVIMAGGKGTRMEPFTKVLPKPLIPVGDKTVAELIIDEFRKHGITEYYLTLNYKGEMIQAYFNGIEKEYMVKYVWEEDFYGTAGSLKLLKDEIGDTFIVSNCDVIVKADFEDVMNMHREQNSLLTVLSSIQHYRIPYGVITFVTGGQVTDIVEKPEYSFTVNTGVYVLNKAALEFIPDKAYFDMTDLIKKLIANNEKVTTYPVNENDYIDIGQWEEYKKAINRLHLI